MDKEIYDRTELEVIRFNTEDVITTSNTSSNPDDDEYQSDFPPKP